MPVTTPFDVEVAASSTHVVLAVTGEIDVSTAALLRTCIEQAGPTAIRPVLLDLSKVDFVDSSGISVMIWAHTRHEAGSFRVVATQPRTQRVFAITAVDQVLAIYESVEAALGQAGGGG